jgi:hypothetical protein
VNIEIEFKCALIQFALSFISIIIIIYFYYIIIMSSSSSSNSSTPIAPHPLPSSSSSSNPLSGGCPVATRGGGGALAGGCPVAKSTSKNEPPISSIGHKGISTISPPTSNSSTLPPSSPYATLPPIGELTPTNSIPAAGRGNSEDGKQWLNPSPNQLFRALHRKDKGIEPEDAPGVANVHVMVTDNTWEGIMEYEKLHQELVVEEMKKEK